MILVLILSKTIHIMARKKKGDHVRTINKIAGGKSYCVTLPITLVRDLNWESQQRVSVKKWGNKIIIQDIKDVPDADTPGTIIDITE